MSAATIRKSRAKLQQVWLLAQEQSSTEAHQAVLAQRLAWIDKRIQRSQANAATSNRARGAVREWSQKRAALLREAEQPVHGMIGPEAMAAQQQLLAGAPQHLRDAEKRARQAMDDARAKLAALDPDSLPTDHKHARDVLRCLEQRHETALRQAIDWLP